MGDIATASHAHDTPLSSIGDDRRPSTSSYGSSTGGVAQDTSGHLDQRKRGNGSMSSADSRNYAGHPQQVVSAATGRQRTGSTGGRPRTSGSEASSVRSTKSGTVVNGSGRIYTSIAPLAGERSSPV